LFAAIPEKDMTAATEIVEQTAMTTSFFGARSSPWGPVSASRTWSALTTAMRTALAAATSAGEATRRWSQ
jgi:hypothetical protein